MVDRYQAGGPGHPARHPAALRRRRRARPRQRARRDGLPAQHRPRRHPQPGAGREDRPHHRDGDPRHRSAVGLRAVRLRGPRRPLGPHLRELRRGPALVDRLETAIDGLQGRPRRPRPTPDRVLATAKHYAGDGVTTYGTGRGRLHRSTRASTEVSRAEFDGLALAPYRPGDQQAPRRLGHAVVLQRRLDRGRPRQPGEDARPPRAITDVLKGELGFDGLRHLRLEGIHQIPGDYPEQVRRRSTPASTCSWSPSGTEQPDRLGRVHPDPDLARRGRRRAEEPDRRRRLADPDREVRARAVREPVHRPAQIDTSAARRTPVARQAVAESQVLLKNTPATLPLSRKQQRCTSPAATPTTSATRPAAGP